ncbi:MAG: ATP-binding protein [Lachnospiraceae bacterium]|nr:ATP-binding protein [Lachnospiraceae bacterium]
MRQLLDCVDILIVAPCYLGYAWATGRFCKRYLGTSGKRELVFVLCSSGSWLVLNIMCRCYHLPQILYEILSHIVFMGLVFFCFRAGWEKKILAASLMMNVSRLVENILGSCLSCLVLFFKHSMKNIPNPLVNDWEGVVLSVVSFCMAAFAVSYMTNHFDTVFSEKPGKWYVTLAVPLFLIIAVFDVADWGACHGIMVRSGGNMGLYYDQIFSNTQFAVLAIISLTAAAFYVFGMDRIYLEQKKSSRYHTQIAVYQMLTEQYRQSERLRHDMKNHIIALSGLVRNEEWEKMGDYLKNMEDCGLESCGDMTGSRAVDALLYQKRQRAKGGNIQWECDVQIPKGNDINEFDLCVLFGNILDNALEACERMQSGQCRFINIQAKTVKKCFLLEVRNSMDRTEKYTDGSTSKEDSQEHGIGLLNVGDVVNKYNGVVNKEAEKGIFVISILIPLQDATHDIKSAV